MQMLSLFNCFNPQVLFGPDGTRGHAFVYLLSPHIRLLLYPSFFLLSRSFKYWLQKDLRISIPHPSHTLLNNSLPCASLQSVGSPAQHRPVWFPPRIGQRGPIVACGRPRTLRSALCWLRWKASVSALLMRRPRCRFDIASTPLISPNYTFK